MDSREQIVKQKQCIARCEKLLSLEKIKKRRADTRRKIELGGLVIKAEMDGFNKSVVLGAIAHAMDLIEKDKAHVLLFESAGDNLFLKNSV